MSIILASASPRRRELMSVITPDFSAVSIDADETLPQGIPALTASEYLAEIKAAAAAEIYPDDYSANVEMLEQVGKDNIFIFGLSSQEVLNIYSSGKSPSSEIYATNPVIKRVVDTLIDGTFNNENIFYDLYKSLVIGDNGFADNYLLLPDFESYLDANAKVKAKYQDKEEWFKSAIINTAKAGYFSSDRTIEDYNREIWHLK